MTDVGKALLQALAPLQEWAKQWAEQLSVQDVNFGIKWVESVQLCW